MARSATCTISARASSRAAMNKKLLESLVKSRRLRRLRSEPRGAADADRRRAGPGQRQCARSRCRPGLAARLARAHGAGHEKNQRASEGNAAWLISHCANGSATKRNCSAFTSPAIRSTITRRTSRRSSSTPSRRSRNDRTRSTRASAASSRRSKSARRKEGKKPWARVVLEDLTGSIEVLVFPDTYAALPRPIDSRRCRRRFPARSAAATTARLFAPRKSLAARGVRATVARTRPTPAA